MDCICNIQCIKIHQPSFFNIYMKIKGKVVYQNIGTGIWGIIADNGTQYEPVNLPEKLKKEGKRVNLTARESDTFSLFMWGSPIEVVSVD